MSRRDNIRRAKDTIAARRAESIATYERHTAEACSRIPGFEEVNRLLSQTGARIMAAAIGKEPGGIERIRQEYELLAARKKLLLRQAGYPEDYCDIRYSCEKCSDTGYVGIDLCDCLRKELIRTSMEASGLYSMVEKQTFDTFSLDYYEKDDKIWMTQNLRQLQEFSSSFIPEKADSYLFLGATGLGKTHLSSAVACRVIETGAYVVYESALNLFGEYETNRFGNGGYGSETGEDLERYTDCDLLLIDDLGCEMTSQFTVSCLYNIINSRLIRHKSTIISTNLSQNELRKRYSDRIVSRIFGEYKLLVFRGTDVREQKIRNRFQKN